MLRAGNTEVDRRALLPGVLSLLLGSCCSFDNPWDPERCDPSCSQSRVCYDGACIRQEEAPGWVSTLAGAGMAGFAEGRTYAARFDTPTDVAVDPVTGAVYVADSNNHCIRMIVGDTVSTLAGDGTAGFADGDAHTARFDTPTGVAVDHTTGAVYVADTENHRVRMIADGTVSTLAGDGTPGEEDGPVATARLSGPVGVAAADGTVYVVNGSESTVRVIADGQVSSEDALFVEPAAVALDGRGRVYAAGSDWSGDGDVRILSDGWWFPLTTGWVSEGQAGRLGPSSGVAVAPAGEVYLADTDHHRVVVVFGELEFMVEAGGDGTRRWIDGAELKPVVGSGTRGFADGWAHEALLDTPGGLDVDADGRLYIADQHNHRVRVVAPGAW